MPDRIRKPQNNAKSIDRWDNEGGAPSGGHHRSARKRPRDTSLQKKQLRKVQEEGSMARHASGRPFPNGWRQRGRQL